MKNNAIIGIVRVVVLIPQWRVIEVWMTTASAKIPSTFPNPASSGFRVVGKIQYRCAINATHRFACFASHSFSLAQKIVNLHL